VIHLGGIGVSPMNPKDQASLGETIKPLPNLMGETPLPPQAGFPIGSRALPARRYSERGRSVLRVYSSLPLGLTVKTEADLVVSIKSSTSCSEVFLPKAAFR
jgi:hypothetical protein